MLKSRLNGSPVVFVSYVDANLHHDMLTGRSVVGAFHFCTQILVDLYSKCQACVRLSVFESEFGAVGVFVYLIADLRCRTSDKIGTTY
jgi:hypothetical protein